MVLLNFMVSKTTLSILKSMAKSSNTTVSGLIRSALNNFYDLDLLEKKLQKNKNITVK